MAVFATAYTDTMGIQAFPRPCPICGLSDRARTGLTESRIPRASGSSHNVKETLRRVLARRYRVATWSDWRWSPGIAPGYSNPSEGGFVGFSGAVTSRSVRSRLSDAPTTAWRSRRIPRPYRRAQSGRACN